MKVGILHLSDLHINTEDDIVLGKTECIVRSIQNEIIEVDQLIILVTGDIAFAGDKVEYEIAYYFLEEIKCQLEKKT